MIELIAGINDQGRRLDRILRKRFPEIPLSFISRLLREKKALVNNAARNGAFRVQSGDKITFDLVETRNTQAIVLQKNAESCYTKKNKDIPQSLSQNNKLNIIFEDDNFLVLNKQKGLLTHGADSLEVLVRKYLSDKMSASLSFKPGPLHRLDRNTSGLLVFGKSLEGARLFTLALQNGKVKKTYHALVDGLVEKANSFTDYFIRDKRAKKTIPAKSAAAKGAKKALLKIRPLEKKEDKTLIEVELETGITHQIRAQCALHGHPLSGDAKYGGSFKKDGYSLSAVKITTPYFVCEL